MLNHPTLWGVAEYDAADKLVAQRVLDGATLERDPTSKSARPSCSSKAGECSDRMYRAGKKAEPAKVEVLDFRDSGESLKVRAESTGEGIWRPNVSPTCRGCLKNRPQRKNADFVPKWLAKAINGLFSRCVLQRRDFLDRSTSPQNSSRARKRGACGFWQLRPSASVCHRLCKETYIHPAELSS
jgi:hypothetical protein